MINRVFARGLCFMLLFTCVLAQEPKNWATAEDHQADSVLQITS
jgi:hypothetical protein